MPDTASAVQVDGLTRHYGDLVAVDHVSFEVRYGETFGFLGPNGAGKTTTIRMLTGLTRPDSGQARVLGLDLAHDLPRIKKQIGVVPEVSNLYAELSAMDNLIFMGQLYGVPRRERRSRAEELLRRFGLWERRHTRFAGLSRGMKRGLTIAAALVHRPRLLFLDEPTVGLDVVSARLLRASVEQMREQGVTIFLTTHYLEEADRLCDRVALIVRGNLIALDTPEALKRSVQQGAIVEARLDATAISEGKLLRFPPGDVAQTLREILAQVESEGYRVAAVNTVQPTLEEAFIELTGLSAEVIRAEKGGR